MWREKKKRSSIKNKLSPDQKNFPCKCRHREQGQERKEGRNKEGREGRKEQKEGRTDGRKEGRNKRRKEERSGFYNSYLEVDLQLGKDYKTYTIIPTSSSLHDMGLRFGV